MRDLGITPNTETLRDYVLPNILNKKTDSYERSLQKLSSFADISMSSLAPAAVIHILNEGDINIAADLGKSLLYSHII